MEKKAIAFLVRTQAVNAGTAHEFINRIQKDLDAGWDILSSTPMGLDTSGGVGGAGAVMVYTALVKYGYFEPVLTTDTEEVETEPEKSE